MIKISPKNKELRVALTGCQRALKIMSPSGSSVRLLGTSNCPPMGWPFQDT